MWEKKGFKCNINISNNIERGCWDKYNLKVDLESTLKILSHYGYKLNGNITKSASTSALLTVKNKYKS